jgi:hypothetical protein
MIVRWVVVQFAVAALEARPDVRGERRKSTGIQGRRSQATATRIKLHHYPTLRPNPCKGIESYRRDSGNRASAEFECSFRRIGPTANPSTRLDNPAKMRYGI